MAVLHKGSASLRSRCTRGGSPAAAIPIYHLSTSPSCHLRTYETTQSVFWIIGCVRLKGVSIRNYNTVINLLTKLIRSGITFFSRNVLLEWPDRSCLLL